MGVENFIPQVLLADMEEMGPTVAPEHKDATQGPDISSIGVPLAIGPDLKI